ncbi:hypothetical protein [Glaciihabitans sp. UYNi722]|uniref:hypothetical protein n=1 Tax=Glaciihabitans sp. UYNi722 TaxID=3156344 RepID=UPI0033928908
MTRITLDSASVGQGLGAAVPSLSVTIEAGTVSVLAVESDERPMLVSLLLGGRLRPDSGTALIDGRDDLDELRRSTALVDTPVVAEPPAGVPLARVVAEEFSFSSRPASRRDVRSFLKRHGIDDYEKLPIRALPAVERIRLLCELAVLRPGVTAIVVTSPERHGAAPSYWFEVLTEIATRGTAVAIVTDAATAGILLGLGACDALAPAAPAAHIAPAAPVAPAEPAEPETVDEHDEEPALPDPIDEPSAPSTPEPLGDAGPSAPASLES